ncbi:hypothetical protein L618_002400000080 [Rhodococcus rhodochrous J45]|uniref:Uncharacterized protein n=1 Tax=Rhodococcus rhodochrous J45 TaxID=935266 RepID=A0A562E3X1_RHORH|nr:hypothetical protein L618_002400000080 [Rhodococcus rhodochrous J45]
MQTGRGLSGRGVVEPDQRCSVEARCFAQCVRFTALEEHRYMDFRSLQLVQQRTGGGVVDHHAEVEKNRLVVAQVDHRSGGVLVIWLVHGASPGKQHFLPIRAYRRREVPRRDDAVF